MGDSILIKGGMVIDPKSGLEEKLDVLISDGRIARMEKEITPSEGWRLVDASSHIVAPGLIDMHVHLREPGEEEKETMESGLMAAARGGITTLCSMPNTDPVADNPIIIRYVKWRAEEVGLVEVLPVGAITKGLKGEEISEIGSLVAAGAVAISDDGRPVMNSEVMRRAMEYSTMFGIPVISHCEDLFLSAGGHMNEGPLSTSLGVKGIPSEAEEIMVARDILLAKLTGAKLHIAHVSTAGSVALIRMAKDMGIKVTAETAPHYFSLTEDAVSQYNTMAKVNPPLRGEEDLEAIRKGLADGTIDVVASDHAPHSMLDKDVDFERAASGISGLETCLGLLITSLVDKGVLTLKEAIAKMTCNPASILNIDRGAIGVGKRADIVVFDPNASWIVDPSRFASKGKNTPFSGWRLKGKVKMTIFKGRIVWEEKVG
jgi:dihydroorotase